MIDTPQLIILKTQPENLRGVVREQKHALQTEMKRARPGDLLLLGEIRKPGSAMVRYAMWFTKQRPAKPGEPEAIWDGQHWPYVVDGKGCCPLNTPFRPEEEKVSSANYGRGGGGTVIYVLAEDAEAFRRKGLLEPFLSPPP